MSTDETIAALDRGELRVAQPDGDEWRVNADVQAAILDYFRSRQMEPREVGPFEYHDKIPLKGGYEELGVRVVPPAVARYGAFLSRGVVLMPSYVNIGAWVGPNVSLTATVPIIDVTGDDPVEYRGYVPPRSIVVPGTRPPEDAPGAFGQTRRLVNTPRDAAL